MTALVPDLLGAGHMVGGHRWLELQVFELAGHWVPETPEPPSKLALDRHSGHAAWRAGQWEERLPVVAVLDHADLVRAPDESWIRCLAAVAAQPDTVARLAGLYRVVLPRLAQRYRSHLAATSPVADGPSRRTLRTVMADLAVDRDEGDDALAALLVDLAAVELAAASVARVEATLLR
jgi:hypothetical protein